MTIKFKDDLHKQRYYCMLDNIKNYNSSYKALVYLLTLDNRCYDYITDIIDCFESRSGITKPDIAFNCGWHNSTSVKTLRLAYNLWNGYVEPRRESLCSPIEIFRCDLSPYYMEAIKLRFPDYFRDD